MIHATRWTVAGATAAMAAVCAVASLPAAAPMAALKVRNPLDEARPSETITIDRAMLATMALDDPRKLVVRDVKARVDLLTQAVDLDDDGKFDEVIFQTSLDAREERSFELAVGERRTPALADFKAYGRFVRERRDDFAWENDLVAHRMYGAALEAWAEEPLTSSTVDVWSKRTPKLVVNEWYLVDDYHRDRGEGADFYSAGKSRGCGGNAPWVGGRLWPSSNFRESHVIANGPIRVVFELTYQRWNVNGQSLGEVKRISLDAGHQMNRFETRYQSVAPLPAQQAIGIKKTKDATTSESTERGLLAQWEPVAGGNGFMGCGIVVPDAGTVAEVAQDDLNRLLVTKVGADGRVVYYAGSAWDRGGRIADAAAWSRYLDAYAARVRTPVVVSLTAAGK